MGQLSAVEALRCERDEKRNAALLGNAAINAVIDEYHDKSQHS